MNTCLVDGCFRARGLCGAHYSRLLAEKRKNAVCISEGCTNKQVSRKLCAVHLADHKAKNGNACLVPGCSRGHTAHGLCSAHLIRVYKKGHVGTDPIRGGSDRRTSEQGYVLVRIAPGEWVPEHRLVMSAKLGRELLPSESVHHINGDRTDNREENLELWSSAQPSGQRIEDKLEHARYIIRQYGSGGEFIFGAGI